MSKLSTLPASNPHVLIVSAEDWQGIYVNGVLVVEGPSLTAVDAFAALDVPVTQRSADLGWFVNEGSTLPEQIKDVVFE